MTKIKTLIITILAVTLLLFVCAGAALTTYADVENTESGGEVSDEEQTDDGFKSVVDGFLSFMREQYGEDYEYYYNHIIEQWGSVEAYLLSFGEKLPEEYQNDWDIFVAWLGEYSVLWAPPLAVIVVLIVVLFGKRKFEKILEKIVVKMVKPIINELNTQSGAMVANLHALKSLLGSNPKFDETVKELEESERELKNG